MGAQFSEDNFTRDAANLLKQDAFSNSIKQTYMSLKVLSIKKSKMKLIVLKLIMVAMSFRN